jgi:succinoglycan biosynthesis protein ExoL
VQTGWWLAERKIGLLLDEPIEESLTRQLSGMTPEAYGLLAEPVATADRSLFLCDDSDCRAMVGALASRR